MLIRNILDETKGDMLIKLEVEPDVNLTRSQIEAMLSFADDEEYSGSVQAGIELLSRKLNLPSIIG